jgi:hypothetical protein
MSQPAVTARTDALQHAIDTIVVALRGSARTSDVDVDREPRTSTVRVTKNDAGIVSLVVDGEHAVTIGLNIVAP